MRIPLQYTLVELGILLDRDPRTVKRWLEANEVPVSKVGRTPCVWLADIAAHIPELERSIIIKRDLTKAS